MWTPPSTALPQIPQARLNICRARDGLELRLLNHALELDMPVLAISRGMQLLNVAHGGRLIQDVPGHREQQEGKTATRNHLIYLSPGSKTAAALRGAGIIGVNSRHHQGLREPQRASQLMTTAYAVDDGIIEGLESPQHTWVIGLQCHPEEMPKVFSNLFSAFHRQGEMYLTARSNG